MPAASPCACCGHRTLAEPPGRTGQICPVCFWEDAREPAGDADGWNGSNGVSLEEAQENFEQSGACDPAFAGDARPPRSDEPRDLRFVPVPEQHRRSAVDVRALIEEAFRGVSRCGGVSLHEAVALDDYAGPQDRSRARALDTDGRWEDVRLEELADPMHDSVPCFLDSIGFRYHLPAYLCGRLTGIFARTGTIAFDSVLHRLTDMRLDREPGMLAWGAAERLDILDPAQRDAVARFFDHLARFSRDETEREDAQQALDRGWSDLLAPPAD